MASSLGARFELVPVATHRDGRPWTKLGQALRGLATLWRLCADGRVALVHVNSSWNVSLLRKAAAVEIARHHGVPVVLQLHGSGFQRGLRRGGPLATLARHAARAVDAVVAATPAWASEAAGLLGVDTVRVVPNIADVAGPIGVAGARRGSQALLFLGRLERAKGVFELVDAFAAAHSTRPWVRLVLAGAGRDEAELRGHIAARGVAGSVDLPGWVSGEAKRRLLSSAACFVLPSYAEGLPLSLLEAMMSGVPIVASDVGGIPEAVRDGAEALLVAPRDGAALTIAIGRVLDDRPLARRLADAARTRALAEFAPERVATTLAEIYENVLAASRSGAARRAA